MVKLTKHFRYLCTFGATTRHVDGHIFVTKSYIPIIRYLSSGGECTLPDVDHTYLVLNGNILNVTGQGGLFLHNATFELHLEPHTRAAAAGLRAEERGRGRGHRCRSAAGGTSQGLAQICELPKNPPQTSLISISIKCHRAFSLPETMIIATMVETLLEGQIYLPFLPIKVTRKDSRYTCVNIASIYKSQVVK